MTQENLNQNNLLTERILNVLFIVILIFIPHLHVVKLFTTNAIFYGWLEYLYIIATPLVILKTLTKSDRFTRDLFILVVPIFLFSLLSINLNEIQLSIRGLTTFFGAFFLASHFPNFLHQVSKPNSRFDFFLVFLIFNYLFVSLWLLLEARLNLTGLFHGDLLEEWSFTRGSTRRAFYAFDSPMVAGTWMWFIGSLFTVYFSEVTEKKRLKFLCYLTGCLCMLSVIVTLSRGPWALVAITLGLLGLKALLSNRIDLTKLVILTFTIVILLFTFFQVATTQLVDSILIYIRDFADPNESANKIRINKWILGFDKMFQNLPYGAGLDTIVGQAAAGRIQHENTYFTSINNLGLIGLFMSIILIPYFLFSIFASFSNTCLKRISTPITILAFITTTPVLLYSFMFPMTSNRISSLVFYLVFFAGFSALYRICPAPNKD